MKNGIIGFILGGAVGGAAAWYFTKKKYMAIANKACDDFTDYVNATSQMDEAYESEVSGYISHASEEDDTEYIIRDEERIQSEADEVEDHEKDIINETKILPPHRIDDSQLGEEGYEIVYYTIFSDDTMSDDFGGISDHNDLLGDELYHNLLKELHELKPEDLIPEVCVRNDEHGTDLVISLDNTMTYKEWMDNDSF